MEVGRWPVERGTWPSLDRPLRDAWIRNAIVMLKAYGAGSPQGRQGDRGRGALRLALVDRKARPLLKRSRWAAIGDAQLFFSVAGWGGPGAHGRSLDPGIVATFRGIFEDLWQALPPTAHEPVRVIDHLEGLLRRHAATLGPLPPGLRSGGGSPEGD